MPANQPASDATRRGDAAWAAAVFYALLLALWAGAELSCRSGVLGVEGVGLQVLHQCLGFLAAALGLGFGLVLLLDGLEARLSSGGEGA